MKSAAVTTGTVAFLSSNTLTLGLCGHLHLHRQVVAWLYHRHGAASVLTVLASDVDGVGRDADFWLCLIVEPENSCVASRCDHVTIEEHGADTDELDELVKSLS